jgi:hypothetical protein
MTAAEPATSPAAGPPTPAEAELAIAMLIDMSVDVRGCAVLGSSGEPLASSGDGERWSEAARALLAAADGAGGEAAASVHVATEDGEVFAARRGELAMVAVADRYALASLMLSDLRSMLRDLAEGRGVPDRRKPHPGELDASEAGAG